LRNVGHILSDSEEHVCRQQGGATPWALNHHGGAKNLNNVEGQKKDLRVTASECPPLSAGLSRTVARKSSNEDFHVCAGGLDIMKICV